jgi:PAS domain S-box-containing protein
VHSSAISLTIQRVLIIFLVLAWPATISAQRGDERPHTNPPRRRVLLLHSYERDSGYGAFARQFRTALSQSSDSLIDFVEVSVQATRDSRNTPEEAVVEYVHSTAADVDLVVPIGGPAALFAQTYRPQLFPATPMLLAGVDRRFVRPGALTENDAAVTVEHNPARIVEDILRVLPDTRTVFVVIGSSRLEQFWLDELKRSLQPFEPRLTFVWTNELSFAETLKRCAQLPPRSAVLYGLLALDAAGIPHTAERVVGELHAAANAPVFALHRTHLGRGIVGGHLMSIEESSRDTAAAAVRVLNGEPPRLISTPAQGQGVPTFDWRELRRWNISESRLPAGSIVLFRESTIWERYRGEIVAGVVFATLQSLLIVALFTYVVRHRRAERSTRERIARLRTEADSSPLMIWSIGADQQVPSVNRPWLEFAGRTIEAQLGTRWNEAVHPEDIDRCLATCNAAFARREPFQMEYRLRRDDGQYRWVLDTGVPRFASGSFVGYVGSTIDVTERKLSALALSRLSRSVLHAQETERASTARKLHEDLCQRIFALTLRLHTLSEELDNGAEIRAQIDALRVQLTNLMGDLVAIPDTAFTRLDLLGLTMCASNLCQEMAARHAMRVDFRSAGLPSALPNDVALELYRVLQEALDNAARHSGVKDVCVWLRGDASAIELEVSDAGRGFDREVAMRSDGLGLVSMRERMHLVQGECVIESRPDEGTRVRARVPRQRASSAPPI